MQIRIPKSHPYPPSAHALPSKKELMAGCEKAIQNLKSEETKLAKQALRKAKFEKLPKPVKYSLIALKEIIKLPYTACKIYTDILETLARGGR